MVEVRASAEDPKTRARLDGRGIALNMIRCNLHRYAQVVDSPDYRRRGLTGKRVVKKRKSIDERREWKKARYCIQD